MGGGVGGGGGGGQGEKGGKRHEGRKSLMGDKKRSIGGTHQHMTASLKTQCN